MKTKQLKHSVEELDKAIDKIQSLDIHVEGGKLYVNLDTPQEEGVSENDNIVR